MISQNKIKRLLRKIETLEKFILEAEDTRTSLFKSSGNLKIESVKNLLHYLALRTHDLRPLQKELSSLAISSLTHSEAYTLNNLQKIKWVLKSIARVDLTNDKFNTLDFKISARISSRNSAALLGKPSYPGQTKLMVTLPVEAADDYLFVKRLVKKGMHIARINTANDKPVTWEKMIIACKKAAKATGQPLKIYMDLEGPKLRIKDIITISPVYTAKKKIPAILVHVGQFLQILLNDSQEYNDEIPAITVMMPGVFDDVKVDEPVWFDDGKLGGIIYSKTKDYILIKIAYTQGKSFKLKAGKGINLPESEVILPALSEGDIKNLPFIAKHADLIGLSFVKTVNDITELQKNLKKLQKENIGIILKIETRKAFDNLPSLLFKVMECNKAGIMIARGDLAVELGFLRLAEVQEEILWLAAAAHLPVIWATQVLDLYVTKGSATRAEISDVVKARRAECIMLNKGPYIIKALKILKDIDLRMYRHEEKELKILSGLNIAKTFFSTTS